MKSCWGSEIIAVKPFLFVLYFLFYLVVFLEYPGLFPLKLEKCESFL